MKRTKNGRDYGTVLVLSAMLVSIPRWAGAFIAADTLTMPELINTVLHYLNLISGVGMGLVEVLGTAYLLDAWGKMKAKRTHNAKHVDQRWLILTGFIVGLFVLMPLILSPYIVARMNGQPLASIASNSFQYVWSAAVVLSPILIIGGVAVARDGLVGSSGTVPANELGERRTKETKDKPKVAPERLAVTFTDWRQVPTDIKRQMSGMSSGEIAETFGLAERTAQNWRKRALEFSGKVSVNGNGIHHG